MRPVFFSRGWTIEKLEEDHGYGNLWGSVGLLNHSICFWLIIVKWTGVMQQLRSVWGFSTRKRWSNSPGKRQKKRIGWTGREAPAETYKISLIQFRFVCLVRISLHSHPFTMCLLSLWWPLNLLFLTDFIPLFSVPRPVFHLFYFFFGCVANEVVFIFSPRYMKLNWGIELSFMAAEMVSLLSVPTCQSGFWSQNGLFIILKPV